MIYFVQKCAVEKDNTLYYINRNLVQKDKENTEMQLVVAALRL